MSHRLFSILAALFTPPALLGGLAFGVEIDAPALFQQLDRNHDGAVVRAEVGPEHRLIFERLLRTGDDDRDGRLTADEMATALTPIRAEKAVVKKQGGRLPGADALVVLLSKMDVNGDQRLMPDEVPPKFQAVFDRMLGAADGNRDGVINNRELAQDAPRLSGIALASAMRMQIDVPRELAKLPPERRNALEADPIQKLGELASDPARAGELFERLDANGDGALVASEFQGPGADRFLRLMTRGDRNRDQRLSRDEFLTAMQRMAAYRNRMDMGGDQPRRPRRKLPPGRPPGAPPKGGSPRNSGNNL